MGREKAINSYKDIKNSYLACDDIEIGVGFEIPLWLLGFLY